MRPPTNAPTTPPTKAPTEIPVDLTSVLDEFAEFDALGEVTIGQS